jgi:hypothetical protein
MNALTRLGFLVTLAGALLAVAPPMAEAYVLIKILCVAVGGALLWTGLFASSSARATVLDRPMAAFGAALVASAAFSVDRPASVFGMYPQMFYGLLPLALCAQVYYASAAVGGDDSARSELEEWLLRISIPFALFGLSQRVFGDLLTGFALMSGRISSTLGSPIMFGACLAVMIPPALDAALRRKSRLGAAALALMLAALVLTWSRGAWLAAAFGAAAYLGLTGRLRLPGRRAAAASLLAVLALLAASRGLRKGDSDVQRLETSKTALTAFVRRPLLGFGPDAFVLAFRRFKTDSFVRVTGVTFTESLNAHDDVLQVAATMGLAGLLAYGWLLWALGARLYALARGGQLRGRDAAGASAVLAAFVVAKFNPVSPSVLVLAALQAGPLCRAETPVTRRAARAAASLAAVFCVCCAAVYARFCAADHDYRDGAGITSAFRLGDPAYMDGVNDLRRATELNPWTMEYLSKRCDVIFRTAPSTPPEQGRQLMEKSLKLTQDGVRAHPANASAHALLATALALSSRFGGRMLPEAQAEIKKASELDPYLTFILRRRMDIDRELGDQADFEATKAAYLRVIALTRETADFTPLIY